MPDSKSDNASKKETPFEALEIPDVAVQPHPTGPIGVPISMPISLDADGDDNEPQARATIDSGRK